jgi:hypothetical protein
VVKRNFNIQLGNGEPTSDLVRAALIWIDGKPATSLVRRFPAVD